ncbi:MAG: glutathione S-transferase family protein [Pseudomonadota bacterium]
MAELVLYGAALSPFVRKVQAVLHHVGADYEIEDVDFFNMPDWFVEISPARRIPVLRDRTIGTSGIPGTIPDSSAIAMFLNQRFDAGLYGDDAFQAGRIAWFEEYADTEFAQTAGLDLFRAIMFPLFRGEAPDVETASKTWNEKFPRFFDYLESALDGKPYFVGDKVSMADISVAAQLLQIDLVAGLPDEGKYPHLVRHTQAMKVAPGFVENLERCSAFISGLLPEKVRLG